MLEVTLLTLLAFALLAVAAVGLLLLKVVLWIVLLPFRLLFGLLFGLLLLPLLALKAFLGLLALIVAGPFVLAAMLIAGLAAAVALLAPLVPLAILAFLIWLIVRAAQPTAVAG
jgi:hypothetical protein